MMLFNLGDLLTALIAGAAFGSGITLLVLWGLESRGGME